MSEHDPLDLDAQSRIKLEAEAAQRQQRSVELEDLKWVMSDARGRRFMWRLLSQARVFQASFTGEALSSAFNEGARSAGLKHLADIHEACPQQYLVMTKEARRDARRTDR